MRYIETSHRLDFFVIRIIPPNQVFFNNPNNCHFMAKWTLNVACRLKFGVFIPRPLYHYHVQHGAIYIHNLKFWLFFHLMRSANASTNHTLIQDFRHFIIPVSRQEYISQHYYPIDGKKGSIFMALGIVIIWSPTSRKPSPFLVVRCLAKFIRGESNSTQLVTVNLVVENVKFMQILNIKLGWVLWLGILADMGVQLIDGDQVFITDMSFMSKFNQYIF